MRAGGPESGISDALGSVILISVIALAVGILAMNIISQPLPQKIPELTADIAMAGNSLLLRHQGGDTLIRSETLILVDGVDQTANFADSSGSTAWRTWAVGDTLSLPVTNGQVPQSVQIVYRGGSFSKVIQSIGIPVGTPTPGGGGGGGVVLVADFSGTPLSGNSPLGVQFTNQSSGPVASYSWDFGDLSTSSAKNPYHQYSSRGTYTVSLTVSNGSVSDTKTRAAYITVYDAPVVANFTATPLNGTAPLTVTFTDLSTGPVTSWNWSFGDGNLSTYQNPVFTYVKAGVYNVSLTVGNGTGYSTATKTSYITVRASGPACFYDNFEGSSINASAWTIVQGDWRVSNGVLSQYADNYGDPKKLVLTSSGITWGNNLTITAKVRTDSWINGDYARGGVSLFADPTTTCNSYSDNKSVTHNDKGCGYNLLFHYTSSNPHNLVQWLDDYVQWVSPGYTYAWSDGQWYWFRMNMSQGTMYGRIWADGSAEPTTWPYTWTSSGRTGYPALNGGATLTAPPYSTGSAHVSFMNVSVCRNGDV